MSSYERVVGGKLNLKGGISLTKQELKKKKKKKKVKVPEGEEGAEGAEEGAKQGSPDAASAKLHSTRNTYAALRLRLLKFYTNGPHAHTSTVSSFVAIETEVGSKWNLTGQALTPFFIVRFDRFGGNRHHGTWEGIRAALPVRVKTCKGDRHFPLKYTSVDALKSFLSPYPTRLPLPNRGCQRRDQFRNGEITFRAKQ
eukprot:7767193-Pyramimonas_sp.AAC.1